MSNEFDLAIVEPALCSWDIQVAAATAAGGRVFAPNGLPVNCIRHDCTMLEHEHADHPDYKFPVAVNYVGPAHDLPDWDTSHCPESHALIYFDSCIAVTLYEYCYAMWSTANGKLMAGSLCARSDWVLSEETLGKIHNLQQDKVSQ